MKARLALITAFACVATFAGIATLPTSHQSGGNGAVSIVPAVLASEAMASVRSAVVDGDTVGEVVVNGKPVLRIRSAAGGLSPVQRAEAVAKRLNELGPASGPAQFSTGTFNGQTAVLASDRLIVTADSLHARMNGTTTAALADQWKSNLNSGWQVTTAAGATAGPLDTADEKQVQKAVPILSLGSGLRVGAALVTGPASQVDKVKVVAQIEGNFKGARIRAYVPIETESLKELHRVPETSVAGIADIKL